VANDATTFFVRRATSADIDKLQFIWQETSDTLAKGDGRFRLGEDAAAGWRKSLLEWLQRDDISIFVAESNLTEGRILGYIVGSVVLNLPILQAAHLGYVTELAVDSHAKTSGLGRALFSALRSWFAERGVTQIEARVPVPHAIAQAFWRAMGASEMYEQMWLKLE
jgi:ribosomal protein S18 acetylase RimI-like enzyme